MRFCVINLKRSPERLERFFDLNECKGKVEVFEAVDGREMKWQALEELGVVKDKLQYYSAGAIGSATSQFLLWKQTASSNEQITILEDDAILHRDFFTKVESIVRSTDVD